LLPHLSQVRNCARLLGVESILAAENGEIEKFRFVKIKLEKSNNSSSKKSSGFGFSASFNGSSPEKTYPGYFIYSIRDRKEDNGGTPDSPQGCGTTQDITFTVIRKN